MENQSLSIVVTVAVLLVPIVAPVFPLNVTLKVSLLSFILLLMIDTTILLFAASPAFQVKVPLFLAEKNHLVRALLGPSGNS
jgi:hypothetical protein